MDNIYSENRNLVSINTYKSVTNSKVLGEIDVYSFLEDICKPKLKVLEKIEEARCFYKKGKKDEYDKIKLTLPCYTLNFGFNKYKKNENIKGSTGLMYLDIDNCTNIDLSNQYIFASWKSLSNNGRGVL